jgi:hypothetical protein
MATLFQALAAICAALLTVGRPFMRTEDPHHKRTHTIVGVFGIICIVIAGALSWSSQSDLTSKLNELRLGISALGEKIGTSGDAAEILAETAKTLDRLNSRVTTVERQAKSADERASAADEKLEFSEVSKLNPFGLLGIAVPPLVEEPTQLSRLISPYVHITAAGILSWDCTTAALAAYDAAITLNNKFPFSYYYKGACGRSQNTSDWEHDIEAARRILLITTTIAGQNPSHSGVLKWIQSGDFGNASRRGG